MELAIQSFLTLFVVMDPIGLVPFFLGLVGHRSGAEQRSVALRAVLVAGGILVIFGLVGGPLLGYLGISLEALRVAGGIMLFRIALDMVTARQSRETDEEQAESATRNQVWVFPLAIPLIAGPGALASVLILTGEAQTQAQGLGVVFSTAAMVLVITYLLLRAAIRLRHLLGTTGINVVTRVLGILLAALAVQYVATGARGLWQG